MAHGGSPFGLEGDAEERAEARRFGDIEEADLNAVEVFGEVENADLGTAEGVGEVEKPDLSSPDFMQG